MVIIKIAIQLIEQPKGAPTQELKFSEHAMGNIERLETATLLNFICCNCLSLGSADTVWPLMFCLSVWCIHVQVG